MYFFSDFFLFCLTFPFLSSIFPSPLRDRQLCKASTFHFFSTTNVFFLHPKTKAVSGKKKASDTASCALPASVRVRCASDAGKRGSDAVSELHIPLPVLPTMPIFNPPPNLHVIPRNTSGRCGA